MAERNDISGVLAARRQIKFPMHQGTGAALPPHSAERLRLSGQRSNFFHEAMPHELEAQPPGILLGIDGKAEPYRTVRRQSRRRGLNEAK